jgi:hypothetical protein
MASIMCGGFFLGIFLYGVNSLNYLTQMYALMKAYTYRSLGGAEAIRGRRRGPGTDSLPVKGCSNASKGSRGCEVRIDDLRIIPLVLIVVIALVLVSKHRP